METIIHTAEVGEGEKSSFYKRNDALNFFLEINVFCENFLKLNIFSKNLSIRY